MKRNVFISFPQIWLCDNVLPQISLLSYVHEWWAYEQGCKLSMTEQSYGSQDGRSIMRFLSFNNNAEFLSTFHQY